MTDRLPQRLHALFAARPAPPHLPPIDRDPEERRGPQLSGIGEYAALLSKLDKIEPPADFVPDNQPLSGGNLQKGQALERRQQRAAQHRASFERQLKEFEETYASGADGSINAKGEGDPYRTLFIGRLDYTLSEQDLRREFEVYGAIRRVHLIRDRESKPRGYAFVEYEDEKGALSAVRDASGMKLKDRRIVVDVQRAGTVEGWKPRRLGGGVGISSRAADKRDLKAAEAGGRYSYADPSYRDGGGGGSRSRYRSHGYRDREEYHSRRSDRDSRYDRDDRYNRRSDRDYSRPSRHGDRYDEGDRYHRAEQSHRSSYRSDRDRDYSYSRRDRESDRDRDHHRESERDRHRESDRDRDHHRESDRDRHRESDRDRDRHRGSDRNRSSRQDRDYSTGGSANREPLTSNGGSVKRSRGEDGEIDDVPEVTADTKKTKVDKD
ncbi:hypothetical protein IWQ60_010597 [Tieghemiomyces parasiticus]|uniref:RRM domain-containing protein n=1 Tax=Tieghemiomyces parasiticus TaxID=78921 RepID=A0A9W7ZU36_9FUNG|nr:hypothetical protein IWQ60_010597 [Tieghemiomyces parasiticus]